MFFGSRRANWSHLAVLRPRDVQLGTVSIFCGFDVRTLTKPLPWARSNAWGCVGRLRPYALLGQSRSISVEP